MKTALLFAACLGILGAAHAANEDGATRARGNDGATRRLALVIGSHEGGEGQDRLMYAGSDAAAFRRTLEELGGLRHGDATLLIDPDSLRVIKALDDLEDRVRALKREGDRVEAVVYYSGHANEKGLLLGAQSIDYRVFRTRMNALGADVRIAVVDACESGALTRLKGGHTAPAFLVDQSTRSEGYAILTSSSESEAAQESDRVGGSFFTNALNSGLRGAADESRDGKVTLHEAYQFAYNETLARTEATRGGPQHAGYDIQLNGSGDVVLTDLRQASAFLDLSSDLAGRLFIRDSSGHLAAELQKPAGRDMRLGLTPGAYEIRLLQGGKWSVAAVQIKQDGAFALAPSAFKAVEGESVAVRGDSTAATADSGSFHYVSDNAAGGFSTDLVYDAQKQDWRGTQVGLLATDARRSLRGGQWSLGFNVVREDLQGYQMSIAVNAVGGSLHGFQLSEANIVSDNILGFQLSPVLNIAGGNVGGVQGAGVFNIAGGGLRGNRDGEISGVSTGTGWQIAGIFNVSGDSSRGAQLAGIFNVTADEVKGAQLAGIFNATGGGLTGGQGAGILNANYGDLRGGQGAGILNFNVGDVKGGQGAGILNFSAGKVTGAQGAGIVNFAWRLQGVQAAGILNAAGKVRGYQIGLVNLSDDYESGVPIGLVNISRKGSFEGETWVEENGMAYAGLRTGARWMHSHFAVGMKQTAGNHQLFAPTLGVSGEYAVNDAFFLEAGLLHSTLFRLEKYAFNDANSNTDWSRLRLGAGYKPLSFLTLIGGLSYNVSVHPDSDEPLTGTEYPFFKTYGNTVSLWPGAYAGIRIGK